MQPVHLTRVFRTVLASGPGGRPLDPESSVFLEEKLTYYERKFNFESSAESGNKFEVTPRQLYARQPKTNLIGFPLGLRQRITSLLRESGREVQYFARPLVQPGTPAAETDWDGMLSEFKVFPGQDTCLLRVVGSDGGVVSSTTGTGKSVIIRMICRLYNKARIHIVTKSATLADEIFQDVQAVIPNVGFVGGGKKRFGRVTVFVADSLHHGLGDCDILLGDECHELAAPSYASILGRYTRARMFGFSATPTGRSDGRDIEVEALFGPILYTMPYQEAVAAGRVVPITVEWLRVKRGPEVGHINNPSYKEKYGIWQNADRNKMIADRAKQFDPDEQVVVMVKTIEHAVRLKQLLPDFTLCYAAKGMTPERIEGYVSSGMLSKDEPLMTKDRLRELRKQFAAGTLKKVISNYVWSTGVNFRNLAVLIRADAAASEIKAGQIPGRICRRVAGMKESAILIDCWDEWNKTFLGRSRTRRASYTRSGWAHLWSESRTDGGS